MREDTLDEVIAAVEALPPGETLATVIPHGATAAERAETLDSIQRVVNELRRRGHSPRVEVGRAENGEIHALSLDR